MRLNLAAVLTLFLVVSACGGSESAPEYDAKETFPSLGVPDAETLEDLDASLGRLADAPIDPPPEVGKHYNPVFPDPIPFDPAEWETNKSPKGVADPRAEKGGEVRIGYTSWPPTIRTEGPNSRLAFLSDMHLMIYETLVGYSMEIQDFVPGLATHWQMLPDKKTFRFRIDPKARWADGREVTADDVVASVEHYLNPDRKDPMVNKYWGDLIEYAKMLDKYTVEVQAKQARWRSMMTIGWGMQIYPAAYIRMDGDTYLDEWNWKLPPGTGPYEIRPEDIKKGRSITLRRRKDYWDQDNPDNKGAYNIDEIVWVIVRDQELMYQKFLEGELDMYQVGRASRWVGELDREESIQKGWVQKRKVYNKVPRGYGGFCFNLRQPPFDSRNVRLAFTHLFNREKLFDKILVNQYEYIDSYFPGQVWARENPQRIRFDPAKARELLAEDGWTKRDAKGYLVNERGERFPELTLEFGAPGFTRIHKVTVDSLWDEAGIKMELKLIDYSSLLKKVWEYKFKVIFWSWTAGLFPEPIQQFHSKYADPLQTNNLNGFKNDEVDQIVTDYQTEFDPQKRKEMMQRLDTILFNEHLYALGWYGPFFRVIYWDKYGHPPEYVSRYTRGWINVMATWWFDPKKEKILVGNMKEKVPSYPDIPNHQYDDTEPDYWNRHEFPMPDEPTPDEE